MNPLGKALLSLVLASSFLFDGCVHRRYNGNEAGFSGGYNENISARKSGKREYETREIGREENGDYVRKDMQIWERRDNEKIGDDFVFEWYDSKGEGEPLIIISPESGSYTASRIFAKYFANKGYSCVIPHRSLKFRDSRDLYALDSFFDEERRRKEVVLDCLIESGEIDSERIGFLGISMGGIEGVRFIAEQGDRIKAGILGLAGGNFPSLIFKSNEPGVRRRRKIYLREIGSEEELKQRLGEVKSDPIKWARHVDPRKILMFVTTKDTWVPTENQVELWESLGRPEVHKLPVGHLGAIAYTFPPIYYIQRESLNFLEKKFNEGKRDPLGRN